MAQFLRPSSDITTTNWTGTFADIDEITASDSDYGYSTIKTLVTYETKLGTGADPISSINHTVRCRVSGWNGSVPNVAGALMTISLYQATTLIATVRASATVSAWEDVVYTLSGAEADAITDYSDLRLRFVVSRLNNKGGVVSWAEMEIPDEPVPSDLTDILTYSFTEQTGGATINTTLHTVDIEVANGTSVTALVATFTLDTGATVKVGAVTQVSGTTPNDFTSPVTYDVTAEDTVTTQAWTITVTVAEASAVVTQINIGDVWKDVVAHQINIGDVWKPVVGIFQNIGGTWKDVLGTAAGFDTDYQAILDRAGVLGYTLPSVLQQEIQNQLVIDLKANAIWIELDTLWMLANDTGNNNFATINWKNPTGNKLTEVGTVNYLKNEGAKPNDTTSYWQTGFVASTDGVKWIQDDAGIFVFVNEIPLTTGDVYNIHTGASVGSDMAHIGWYETDDYMVGRLNTNQYMGSSALGNLDGFVAATRPSGIAQSMWHNGTVIDTDPDTTIGVPSIEFYINAENDDGVMTYDSDATLGFVSYGSNLESKQTEFSTLINDYMVDIGNVYPQNNAASSIIEMNATTGFTDYLGSTTTSDATEFYNGEYSIKVLGSTSEFGNGYITMLTTPNRVYTYDFWAKRGIGTGQQVTFSTGGGWLATVDIPITSTSWTRYTGSITMGTGSTGDINVYPRRTGVDGDTIFIDNIQIY